jgi:hypothetical protein
LAFGNDGWLEGSRAGAVLEQELVIIELQVGIFGKYLKMILENAIAALYIDRQHRRRHAL